MSDPTIVSESIENDGTLSFENTLFSNGEDVWVPITGSK
jgi:hypothetical protein